jgi:hypothetical protein
MIEVMGSIKKVFNKDESIDIDGAKRKNRAPFCT